VEHCGQAQHHQGPAESDSRLNRMKTRGHVTANELLAAADWNVTKSTSDTIG
jgi:hypothetical protein